MLQRIALVVTFALVACGSNDEKLKVTGFDKTEIDATGGTYIAVSGNGFTKTAHGAKVWFGGQPGQVIRFASDSEMIVQAPGGKVGDTVDVLFKFEPGGEVKMAKAFKFVDKTPASVNVKDLDTSKTK
jgi:hypothetical protein